MTLTVSCTMQGIHSLGNLQTKQIFIILVLKTIEIKSQVKLFYIVLFVPFTYKLSFSLNKVNDCTL